MTLADSNVWLALTLSKHIFHAATQAWFAAEPKSAKILFCRSTQQSYLRLFTTKAVVAPFGVPPLTNDEALLAYQGWFADSRIEFANEPAGVERLWKKLAGRKTSSPKVWMDAYLAAFAIAGGFQLVTTDKDFQQFSGLNSLVLSK